MTTSVTVLSSIPGAAAGEIVQVLFESSISGPTAISVPGVEAGDIMLTLVDTASNVSALSQNHFEAVISNNDQIAQLSTYVVAYQFSALFYRAL